MVACCRVGALSVAVHVWDLLKEVAIIFITFTIVWPQVNSREGTQLHPSTENWVKDLLSMSLPIRTRRSFPLHQSLPSGIFHKPLILLYQRADRLKTTILTVRLSLIKKIRVHTFFKEVKKRDSLCNVGENVN